MVKNKYDWKLIYHLVSGFAGEGQGSNERVVHDIRGFGDAQSEANIGSINWASTLTKTIIINASPDMW